MIDERAIDGRGRQTLRHRIAIRIAVSAPAGRVAATVVSEIFAMVTSRAVFGAGIGLAAPRYLDALLYEVKPTGLDVLV